MNFSPGIVGYAVDVQQMKNRWFSFKNTTTKSPILVQCYDRSLGWIKANTLFEQGIAVSSKKRMPYLEVTGYLIPTLMDAGEVRLARQYAEFLSYMQRPNGSFAGPDGVEYFFDSGQGLRGLLCAARIWDKYRVSAQKTTEYLLSSIREDGSIPSNYGGSIPEGVHVFVLPVLAEACRTLNMTSHLAAVQNSVRYYQGFPGILSDKTLTHFLAYIADGFIDLGLDDFVRQLVQKVFSRQRKDGGIPAYPNVKWSCSVGVAQFAAIGYKLGMNSAADKALAYLCRNQNSSGGFYGSRGINAGYFPGEEISWACKFFLDAVHMKVESFFDSNAEIFPSEVPANDGRLDEIREQLGDLRGKRILDAGCGKGRFASRIKDATPSCEIHGVDVSEELLKKVPASIIVRKGSILNLPYDSDSFDAVFCVEALEHTIRIERAINELCRVLKPGGRLVIIDKNIEKLGTMRITDFEQWFDANHIADVIRRSCEKVIVKEIAYDGRSVDGLFISWSGTKSESALGESEWHDAMVGRNRVEDLVEKVRSNQFPVWIKPLLAMTSPGDSVLELGSGTGELSAILAIYGRDTYMMDYSRRNLESSRDLFRRLGIEASFHSGNVLGGLPFGSSSVDWVWSSGLLEHFSSDEILFILKESIRVCRKGVMSLVPNAGSVLYRLGKMTRELDGTWIYGKEEPRLTMKPLFDKAGLHTTQEYSVGPYHSISFVNHSGQGFKTLYDGMDSDELRALNQGYLVFTYGEKNAHRQES